MIKLMNTAFICILVASLPFILTWLGGADPFVRGEKLQLDFSVSVLLFVCSLGCWAVQGRK